ncbi:TIGR04255 family protein [Nocardioides aquiterrae]|uniref:TIGR04255 family protein n=1 Tax=Nocardioides aquiterrae TaxID=203799 RepID=A0ABN1UA47_9ACTN
MSNRFADLPFDDRQVERAPLANVIWQVRFASDVKLDDGRAAFEFQASLGPDLKLTRIRNETLFQMSIGSVQPIAGGPQAGEDVWRLVSPDGRATVTLGRDVVTFETQSYGAWKGNFRDWIAALLSAVDKVMSPGVTTRVGLRFVNTAFAAAFEAEPFQNPTDLTPFISDRFLGFDPQGIDTKVGMTQSRHVLVVEDLNAAVSSALINQESGEYGILIDIDTYREATKAFDAEELLEVSDELHDLELALFQQVLTKDGWLALGPIDGGDAK